MAQTLEHLSRQNDTLGSIRGIVHTMKTLSVINATPYEHAAHSIEAYHQTILQGFAAFAHRTGEIALHPEDVREQLVVVFGSDHGLCGSYNEILAEEVNTHCRGAQTSSTPRLICIGVQMNDALCDLGLAPAVILLPPASAEGIGRLAGDIVTRLATISRGQPLHRLGGRRRLPNVAGMACANRSPNACCHWSPACSGAKGAGLRAACRTTA